MRTEVYSWRLPGELKSDLEREARIRRVSSSAILDMALRDWLKQRGGHDGDELQRNLHSEAASCLGVLTGRNPRRAETARDSIRTRLTRRRAR